MRTEILRYLACLMLFTSCENSTSKNYSCNENPNSQDKLLAFVGERIEVKTLPDRTNVNEAKFSAKYKILEKLCGDYNSDTITFDVINWFVDSSFKKNSHILLFLVKDTIEYLDYWMRGYQYFNLFKTMDGRWASPYPSNYYDNYVSLKNTAIRPKKIVFKDEVSFDIKSFNKTEISQQFPEPYYKIKNDKAIAVYGNYADELLQLQKDGLLNSWGMFGIHDTIKINEVKLKDINLH